MEVRRQWIQRRKELLLNNYGCRRLVRVKIRLLTFATRRRRTGAHG